MGQATMKEKLDNYDKVKKALCCCQEDLEKLQTDCTRCTSALYSDANENLIPDPVSGGDTYEVTITYKGFPIIFESFTSETKAQILLALNTEYADFKIVFSEDSNGFLQAQVSDSDIACQLAFETEILPAP